MPRANYGKFSVKFAAGDFWNNKPLYIKNAASFQCFRKKLKGHLLNLNPENDPLLRS